MTYIRYANTLNPVTLDDGIQAASRFLLERAETITRELGFGYVASPDAPNTYESLMREFVRSSNTNVPLPVSSLNLDDCFYVPEVTHALRFVHDMAHVMTGLTFDVNEEVELALLQMEDFKKHGLDPDTLEYQLLYADHVGQAMAMAVNRKFVIDQSVFILDAVTYGLDFAIVREMKRGDLPEAV
ncbi:hypothetical protein G6024_01045 [Dietzia maris]|nr:hypothetical protein [Dietzia maris]MBB0995708.1 hypothetical protein [Dietzia maris]